MSLTLGIFIVILLITPRHHLLGGQAHAHHERFLRRRQPAHRGAKRFCAGGRLVQRRRVSRIYRTDCAVRHGRRVLRPRPAGRLLHGAVSDRRAAAQYRQDTRSATSSAAACRRAPRCSRRSSDTVVVNFAYLMPQMAGAGVLVRLLTGISYDWADDLRRHQHDRLCRVRRHAGDDLGADRQGRADAERAARSSW